MQGNKDEAAALGDPPGPARVMDTSVSLRLTKGVNVHTVMHLEVAGPDRTNVEGLTTRLVEVLTRSAVGPRNVPQLAWIMVAIFGAEIGFLLAFSLVHAFELAPVNNRFEWQEIVFPAVAAIVIIGFLGALAWALPSLELLDGDERSRFMRFRTSLLAGLGAVTAGFIATALWVALT
jgi:hypothetical protein